MGVSLLQATRPALVFMSAYLFWWIFIVVVVYPEYWSWTVLLTSLAVAFIVGIHLNVNAFTGFAARGGTWRMFWRDNKWEGVRFFLTPFCVASFGAIAAKKGDFVLFFPRDLRLVIGGIAVTLALSALLTLLHRFLLRRSLTSANGELEGHLLVDHLDAHALSTSEDVSLELNPGLSGGAGRTDMETDGSHDR